MATPIADCSSCLPTTTRAISGRTAGLTEPDWMENAILRMQLQAFAAGYPEELGRNEGMVVLYSELDRIVPYGSRA